MPDNKRQRAVLHVCRERTCWLLLCVVNGGHVCMYEACRDTWSSTYGFSALTSLLLWLCPVCSNWLVNTGSLPVPVNRKQSPGCCWAANGRWLHPPHVLQVSNPQRSLGCSHIYLCWCTHTSFIIYEYERLYSFIHVLIYAGTDTPVHFLSTCSEFIAHEDSGLFETQTHGREIKVFKSDFIYKARNLPFLIASHTLCTPTLKPNVSVFIFFISLLMLFHCRHLSVGPRCRIHLTCSRLLIRSPSVVRKVDVFFIT